MVDLPEEDGPERPRIMGRRLAESGANEEEEGGRGRMGLVGVDNEEGSNGEELDEDEDLVNGIVPITSPLVWRTL